MIDPYDEYDLSSVVVIVPYDPKYSDERSVLRQALFMLKGMVTAKDTLADIYFWNIRDNMVTVEESGFFSGWPEEGAAYMPNLEAHLLIHDCYWEVRDFQQEYEDSSECVGIHTSAGPRNIELVSQYEHRMPKFYHRMGLRRMDLLSLTGTPRIQGQ